MTSSSFLFLFRKKWEGENYILSKKTPPYLPKPFPHLVPGKNPSQEIPTFSYLTTYLHNPTATCQAITPADFLNPEFILAAFAHRAAHLIAQTVDQLDHQGCTWNSMLVEVYRISRAHCQLVLVQNFFSALQSDPDLHAPERAAVRRALQTQAQLFA